MQRHIAQLLVARQGNQGSTFGCPTARNGCPGQPGNRLCETLRFFINFIPRQITIRTFCHQTDTIELLQLSKTNRPLSNSSSLLSVKPVFDSYLRMFQTEAPLIHCLHQSMVDLVKVILLRFMKADKVNSLTSKDYKNLDVTKDHLKREDVELGPAARGFLKHVKSQRTRTEIELSVF